MAPRKVDPKAVQAAADRAEGVHPGGRPTKYNVAYCDEVIAAGDRGLSLTAFAGIIGVARSTINEWMANFPEFSEAVRLHAAKRTLYLEQTLLSAENGPQVTARIFALKNAAPDEWRDKQQLEHSGPDGGAIQTAAKVDFSAFSKDEREALRYLAEKAKAKE